MICGLFCGVIHVTFPGLSVIGYVFSALHGSDTSGVTTLGGGLWWEVWIGTVVYYWSGISVSALITDTEVAYYCDRIGCGTDMLNISSI